MAKVIPFSGKAYKELTPKDVLEVAAKRELDGVIVIGYTEEDGYLAYSIPCLSDLILMLEKVKLKFLLEELTDDEDP